MATRQEREALAAIIDCPPSLQESDTYPLCKQTGISYTHLLRIMSRCNGNYRLFLSELGLKSSQVADNGYWLPLCKYTHEYMLQWERQLSNALEALALLPEDERQAKEEEYAKALNIPVAFLQDWLPNGVALRQIVEDIRPDIIAKAKMNLYSAVAAGDVRTSLELVKMDQALELANKSDKNVDKVVIEYAD